MMMELKHLRIKKEGVGNLVTCMIAIVILMAVMGYSVVTYTNLNLAIKKGRIERSVLLQMETEGYLSAAARDELTRQLTDLGVEGISFAGTTMTPAGYGNTVGDRHNQDEEHHRTKKSVRVFTGERCK